MSANPKQVGSGAQAPGPASGTPHGTPSGYSWHGCRCDECKAYKRNADRAQYERKREARIAQQRDYHHANRDAILARRREAYAANLEAERAKKREWAAAHPAAAIERTRRWSQLPHAKVSRRLSAHRRRQQKFDTEARAYAVILLNDPCSYCGGPGGTIDHIVPVSAGGDSHWSNLTAACKSCNSRKNDIPLLHFLLRNS